MASLTVTGGQTQKPGSGTKLSLRGHAFPCILGPSSCLEGRLVSVQKELISCALCASSHWPPDSQYSNTAPHVVGDALPVVVALQILELRHTRLLIAALGTDEMALADCGVPAPLAKFALCVNCLR